MADRAYTNGVNRRMLAARGVKTVIPQKATEIAARLRKGSAGGRPPALDPEIYKGRNVVDRSFNQSKQRRGLATRYDKLAISPTGPQPCSRAASAGSTYWETPCPDRVLLTGHAGPQSFRLLEVCAMRRGHVTGCRSPYAEQFDASGGNLGLSLVPCLLSPPNAGKEACQQVRARRRDRGNESSRSTAPLLPDFNWLTDPARGKLSQVTLSEVSLGDAAGSRSAGRNVPLGPDIGPPPRHWPGVLRR